MFAIEISAEGLLPLGNPQMDPKSVLYPVEFYTKTAYVHRIAGQDVMYYHHLSTMTCIKHLIVKQLATK